MVENHEKINDLENTEILINYCNDLWNRNEIIIDDMFAFSVAHEIIHDDYELRSIIECRQDKIGQNGRKQSKQNCLHSPNETCLGLLLEPLTM